MAKTSTRNPNYNQVEKYGNDTEAALLTTIEENSQLPKKEQQRYQQLWRKCEDETLSEDELIEYQALLSQLEVLNLKRIEALIALAESRGKTLGEITADILLDARGQVEPQLVL